MYPVGQALTALMRRTLQIIYMVKNEEAVKEMGLKNPIGKWISAWNKKRPHNRRTEGFHTQSLHEPYDL